MIKKIIALGYLSLLILIISGCKKLDRDNLLDGSNSKQIVDGILLKFDSYTVYSDNNNDKFINKGENIKINVTLKNSGSKKATKVKATFSSTSNYISNITPSTATSFYQYGSYDYIEGGSTGTVSSSSSYLSFSISNATPNGTVIPISVTITDEFNNTWTDSFSVTVVGIGASIGFANFSVYSDNNNDQKINKGESIKLNVSLKNTGSSKVNKVKATISTSSSYISGLLPSTATSFYQYGSYDYIESGSTGTVSSSSNYLCFNVSNSTPIGTIINFTISITDESNNTWSDTFSVTVVANDGLIGFGNYTVFSDNNNDQKINKGETIKLNVSLKNTGSSKVNKVKAIISTSSSYISSLTPSVSTSYYQYGSYDYIESGSTGTVSSSSNYLSFTVSNSTPSGTVITFNIQSIDESNNTWNDSFTITVVNSDALISFASYSLVSDGNKNQQINKGESIQLEVLLKNTGSSKANNVKASISSSNQYISNLTPTTPTFYNSFAQNCIFPGTTTQSNNYINFNISPTAPTGTIIYFTISITDESSNSWNSNFSITVI